MHPRTIKVFIWFTLFLLLSISTGWALNPMALRAVAKSSDAKGAENIAPTEPLGTENVDRIVAALSDEQVRRLLLDELKEQARQEALATSGQTQPTGIAGFIHKIKELTTLLQTRIEYLQSSDSTAPQEITGIFASLGKGERGGKTVMGVIWTIGAVLVASLLIEWLFILYTAAARRRIESTNPVKVSAKIGSLAMRAFLDFAAIVVFIIAALAVFYIFLDRTAGQRVFLAAYMATLVIVQVAFLVSRFFLAPGAPSLRLLPLSDDTARYLHRWLIALTAVAAFGTLTGGVIRLAGASELQTLLTTTLMGVTMVIMIIWMILQKRKAAAAALSSGLPESSLRYRLATKWHHFAILAVVLLLIFSIANRILGFAGGQGTLTLLMVPLYFLLDWILRSILDAVFGMVPESNSPPASTEIPSTAPREEGATEVAQEDADETPETKPTQGGGLELDRMKGPLRTALRLALVALLFFWILDIWGISLPIGETVVQTVLEILVIVLVCYVGWGIINAAIQRRMQQEMPEEDEEAEEGGAGGSRMGTLLLLLRKFLLVVILVMAILIILSSLGVNIGPLIAGAGVFGLAIGFGAQTLVKDIISGVFFLMDDAFRVGDYLEVSGSKGTVEHISLRSLRLRNPRGMVNFIPFGDIKLVTNLSRDYVIMKLDFRVRYDADVERIRKIIKKKVYKKIMADPELGPKLLEPIKSQGVREMDDSAMVMRVKYKTKPGDQFAIRKQVYRLMQEAFTKEGIEFAHRNVTVYMPPDPGQPAAEQPATESQPADAKTAGDVQRQAAAGAALAAIQAEEEEKAKLAPKK